MKTPPKRKNKSKEEIAYEQKMAASTRLKREFITKTFFPLLKKQTKTVHQAKQVCKLFQNDIMSTFNEGLKLPVSTLNLEKKLDGWDDDASAAFKELIDAFKDMTIADAMEVISGMPQAIEGAFTVLDRHRTVEDLIWEEDGTMKVARESEQKRLLEEASCNDLRMLSNGVWFAYSTKSTKDGQFIKASGSSIREAITNLIEEVKQKAV